MNISDVLYANKKVAPCTHPNPESIPSVTVKPQVVTTLPIVPKMPEMKSSNISPQNVTVNQPKIMINPVINLHTSDLIISQNYLQIPPIDVQLTINIQ